MDIIKKAQELADSRRANEHINAARRFEEHKQQDIKSAANKKRALKILEQCTEHPDFTLKGSNLIHKTVRVILTIENVQLTDKIELVVFGVLGNKNHITVSIDLFEDFVIKHLANFL